MNLQTLLHTTTDGETQTVESRFRGECSARGEKLLLSYDEPENHGRTLVKIEPLRAVIQRNGDARSQMYFEPGTRLKSAYQIAEGAFDIETETRRYDLSVTEDGGRLRLDYILYINGQKMSDNILTLNWTL